MKRALEVTSDHVLEMGTSEVNPIKWGLIYLFFSDVVDIEQFLDWIYEVERFFDIMRIEAERKVDFVAYKLRGGGGAGAWWQCHQDLLRSRGQPLIRNWTQMKTLLKGRFLPLDYEQVLFQRFQNCYQCLPTLRSFYICKLDAIWMKMKTSKLRIMWMDWIIVFKTIWPCKVYGQLIRLRIWHWGQSASYNQRRH